MIADLDEWFEVPAVAGWHWCRRVGQAAWDAEVCKVSIFDNGEAWVRRIGRPWEQVSSRWEFLGPIAMPILGLSMN